MSSSKTPIIDISSDSSSSSEGWSKYFPNDYTSTSRNKNPKKRNEPSSSEDLSTPPSHIDNSSSDTSGEEFEGWPKYLSYYEDASEDQSQSPSLAGILTKEMEKAVAAMSKIPVPEKSQLPPKPRQQVLGLASPKVYDLISGLGVRKVMPDYKVKGKGKLE